MFKKAYNLKFWVLLASATLTAGAQGQSALLEEVVVTATKRDQSLLDVPSSVSVITSQDIQDAGIRRPKDFLSSIPNVTFIEDNAGEVYINIRGQTAVRSGDPNVAVVIDGVPLVTLKSFNQDLFDIEQIEVLKGPQSAVYGRNAAAGAVVITTKKPTDELEGSINVGAGNWDSWQVSGGVSGPITDTLKYNLSGSKRATDGPFTSVTGIKVHEFETELARLRLLWEPSERMSVNLKLAAHSSDGPSMGYNAQQVGFGFGGVILEDTLDVNSANQRFISDVAGVFDEEMIDSVLDVEYSFDAFSVRSITSYNKFDQVFAGDLIPYLPFGDPRVGLSGSADLTQAYTVYDETVSQEFRISSNSDGNVQWMAGVYYLDYKREQYSEFNVDDGSGRTLVTSGVDSFLTSSNPTVVYNATDRDTENYAAFANVQWDISDSWRAEFAGRYDREERSIDDFTPASNDGLVPLSACLPDPDLSCSDSEVFTNFSPKVSLIYTMSEDVNVYANYGKGYKAGGFNAIGSRQRLINVSPPGTQVFVQDSYDEEESDSYELGMKGSFFSGALLINAGVFYTIVEGAQQFEFFPTSGDQTVTSLDEVELRGFDVDFQAMLPSDVRLFGGFGYVDGELTEFTANPDFEGNTAPGTTEYTATLGATRVFNLNDSLTLTPRVEVYAYGPIWWDFANTPGTERDPVELLEARLTLASQDWELAAWGKNLTDEEYFQEYVPLLGVLAVAYRAPTRSYGIDFTYRF